MEWVHVNEFLTYAEEYVILKRYPEGVFPNTHDALEPCVYEVFYRGRSLFNGFFVTTLESAKGYAEGHKLGWPKSV